MCKPIKINHLQFVTIAPVQGEQAERHTTPSSKEQGTVIAKSYIEQQARKFIEECDSLGIVSEAEE